MAFEIETEKFEGPLDLMLHLIREQQLDIFDLDMAVLADQYLSYLHKMESLQLFRLMVQEKFGQKVKTEIFIGI